MVLFLLNVILTAYNIQGTLSQKVELYPPLAEVQVNGNATLTCSFETNGLRFGKITTWNRNLNYAGIISYKNGMCTTYDSLQNESLYAWTCQEGHHNLTIKNIQRDQHFETWTCYVSYESIGEIKSNLSSVYITVPVANVTLQDGTNSTWITVAENSATILSCNTSYSRPSPNVYWYLNNGRNDRNDDQRITSNISVIISNKTDGYSNNSFIYSIQSFLTYRVKRQVNGWRIYCKASNEVGQTKSSGQVKLNVTYPPDQPVILGNISGTYKVIENHEANISCSVLGGNPRASISLTCSIQAVITNNNAYMRRDIVWNVTRQHNSKQCTCEAVQIDWNKAINVTLEVLYPPNIPTIRWNYTHENNTFSGNDIKAIENVSIKAKCEADSKPKSRYMWLNQTMTGKMLDLQNISRYHKGVYVCLALNEMHPSKGQMVTRSNKQVVNIDVLYPPKVKKLQNISLIEGRSKSVVCNTSFGYPKETSFEWTSDTVGGSPWIVEGNQMQLNDVSRDMSGIYRCTANNTMAPTNAPEVVGNSSSSLYFSVLYPPNIPSISLRYNNSSTEFKISQNMYLMENTTFALICNASGKPTPINYSWRAKTHLENYTNAELWIDMVKRHQSGMYSCYVRNIMTDSDGTSVEGTNSTSIHIDILYPPMIATLHNETVIEGRPFMKTCKMDDLGMPEVSNFIWTRDGGDKNWTTATMQIPNISRADSMQYTCSAYNKMISTFGNHTSEGKSKRHFNLDVVYSALIKEFYFFALGDKMISTINKAETFQITCAVESNPAPNVSVSFPNGTKRSVKGNYNLFVVQNATCLHAGKYTCIGLNMHNLNGGDLREKNLFVRCPPKPSNTMKPNRTIVKSARYDSALLRFDAYPFYDPNPTLFLWTKRLDSVWKNISWTENIQVSSNGSQSNLTVGRVTESDYGEYLLIYKNSAGTSNYTFKMEEDSAVPVTDSTQSDSITVVVVVVITIGILICVVVIVIVAIYCYRKRRNDTDNDKLLYQNVPFNGKLPTTRMNSNNVSIEETSFEGQLQEVDDVPHVINEPTEYCNSPDSIAKIDRIKVSELFSYVLGKPDDAFGDDYHKLPTELQMPCTFARKPENIAMNRYNGIYPYDHSRVMLNDEPDFFINACYIDGYRRRKAYIASLGPTEKTTCGFITFWKMVWFERSDIIVMLTNLREPSGMKCERYWPEKGKDASYGDISVSAKTTDVFSEYTVRTFTVSKNGERRSLTLLHYTAWPDKKVPEDTTSLLVFRQRMKATPSSSHGPIIVHCSAGIGRTGTLIALDRLIEEGQREGSVNVYECVKSMREQRVKMVQTLEQYIYIYKALVNALTFDCEEIPAETFLEYIDTTSKNMYSRQFQQLRQSVEADKKDELEARSANAKLTNNNRKGADVPGNCNRVFLYSNSWRVDTEYINAVYMNSFKKRDYFIVTQSPLPSGTSDFIHMIYQENCSFIVTMEDLKEPGMAVGQYIDDGGRSLTFGHFTVSCSTLETKKHYIVRKMNIKLNGKLDNGEKVVYHFQYTKWMKGRETPENAREFMQFVHDVDDYASQLGDDRSNLLVYCLKANQRSGLFCAMTILMEQIEVERQVSVLNTLRHLRTRRQSAITSMEQLKFCYEAVGDYIKMYQH